MNRSHGPLERQVQQQTRCPYCHEAVDALERAWVCAGCAAPHHSACHRTHGSCASCGAGLALPTSETQRVQPPAGVIQVEPRADDSVEYSWPVVNSRNLKQLVLRSLLLLPFLVGFWMLYRVLQAKVRSERVGVFLGPERFVLNGYLGGVWGRQTQWETNREGVSNVLVARQAQNTALTVQLPGLKALVGASNSQETLTAEEVEWLHVQLTAWKNGRRPYTSEAIPAKEAT